MLRRANRDNSAASWSEVGALLLLLVLLLLLLIVLAVLLILLPPLPLLLMPVVVMLPLLRLELLESADDARTAAGFVSTTSTVGSFRSPPPGVDGAFFFIFSRTAGTIGFALILPVDKLAGLFTSLSPRTKHQIQFSPAHV